VLDQQTHDLCIAISGRVVDRLIAATVRHCRQMWMPAEQRTYPRSVREKDRRQQLAR
jgi:hypothetical protein